MELSLSQGFINIFRNIPFVGPVIEEIQDTSPRERLKYAIKRLIFTAAGASVVAASIPTFVELSKDLAAAFVAVGVLDACAAAAAANESSKFEQIIDEMDEDTFSRFYTVIACGPFAPLIFDSRELKKVLNMALNRFKAIIKSVQRALKKASELVWEFVVAQVASSMGMTPEDLKSAVKTAKSVASTGYTIGVFGWYTWKFLKDTDFI